MLETLQIRNLALVQSLEIDFGAGLNTITGETGAGKSLVIGAIQLLAGARANPSSIRKGEKSCEVAGIFNLEHVLPEIKEGIAEKLEEADLPPCDEDRLLIRRIVTENGSKAYVNGSMVTAGFLKELCGNLIDLHGPHDNRTRQTGQLCHMDAKTLICSTAFNFPEKQNAVPPFKNGDLVIDNSLYISLKLTQFMIVGGKQRFCADLAFVDQIFND